MADGDNNAGGGDSLAVSNENDGNANNKNDRLPTSTDDGNHGTPKAYSNRGEAGGTDNTNDTKTDEEGRTCGICPRVIKGKLIGNEDGCSVDVYINPCTMLLSVLIIWSFVIWCAIDEEAGYHIGKLQEWIVYYWTWFYVGSLVFFGGFITFLLVSQYGDIKLGPENEEPRFSLGTWFSMLFSAGVGVGLYFFGVAEPVWHYYDAKNGHNRYYTDGDNLERALDAMNISWFHWGLTASSVYCVVGLPLAYFNHVKNAPLKFSAAFIPLIGKKYANGFVGDAIDTFAVVGTMFGVATSLGLGVIQLNGMLNYLSPDNIENEDTDLRILIIWIITAFATISVFTGLDVGIRRLSEGNFAFCLILLIYLFFICDPYYLTNLFIQTAGYHLNHLLEITFFTDAFAQVGFTDEDTNYEYFMSWWTIFYWGWWIAWSPFVGIFIAQISRGRTIREFILGNMFVPTLFTSIWLCVFGGIGLYHELAFDNINGNYAVDGLISINGTAKYSYNDSILLNDSSLVNQSYTYTYTLDSVCSDEYMKSTFKGQNVVYLECYATERMLFAMIDQYPLGSLMNILAGIGIVTYFVTSSDSASHVIDMLTANGNEEPPKIQRIFWALSEGAVASVLLAVGGKDALAALQTVSIAAGLPFCAILLALCYAFWFALKTDTDDALIAEQELIEMELMKNDNPNLNNNNSQSIFLKSMSMMRSQSRIKVEKIKKQRALAKQWELDFLDSTNPQLTDSNLMKTFVLSLICPCIMQWQNYNRMCERDDNSMIFSHNSVGAKAFWAFLIFGTSLLALIFFLLGAAGVEGWDTVGLTIYVFFLTVNAWQRSRIRSYFGIISYSQGVICDVLSHLCCCYCWAMTQENVQCNSDAPAATDIMVELMANKGYDKD